MDWYLAQSPFEKLHLASDGNICRDSHPNITRNSENPEKRREKNCRSQRVKENKNPTNHGS